MKLQAKILITVLLLVLISLLLYYQGVKKEQVCFQETCFSVEIVDTPFLRQQGLMHRTSLDSQAGMLFLFEEPGVYPFWMKDTLIPLDIIWINSNKQVVFISHNTPPCEKDPCPSYNPNIESLYVLEINGGKAKKIGLNVGDTLIF